MNERKRKLSKKCIEEIAHYYHHLAPMDPRGMTSKMYALDLIHDLELERAEIERLRELAAWRKAAIEMLIDCAKNHAIDCECPLKAQAALDSDD